MNKTEKEFKKRMEENLNVKDSYQDIISKIDFNREEKTMNKKFVFIGAGALAVTLAGVGIGIHLMNNNLGSTELSDPVSIVSLDVNPSIDVVVDKNQRVISVTGNNDEGKMIVAEEEIIGKELDEVIDLLITLETETGYLIKGSVTEDENTITISVSADDEEIKRVMEETVTNTINEVCEELNVSENIEKVEKYNREILEQKAMACDPTLTEEVVKDMTYQQLLDVISLYHLETAEIYSAELEALYLEAREYEFDFAEKEAVNDIIDEVDLIYQFLLEGYSAVVTELKSAYESIEDLRYSLLVEETSLYQKALKDVYEAKEAVNVAKNEVASQETVNEDLLALLEAKESLLNQALTVLTETETSINETLDVSKDTIAKIVAQLEELQASFPSEIKTKLQEKTVEVQNKLNETKDNFFESFENEYEDDIIRFKEEAVQRKEQLKASIAGNK